MSKNIEMNILTSSGVYEALYPKTLGSLVDGKVGSAGTADSATNATTAGTCTGNANTATTLQNSRNLQVQLNSTSAVGFNGGSNVTNIGVSNQLQLGNGGTGGTTAATGLHNLINGSGVLSSVVAGTNFGASNGTTGYKVAASAILTYIKNNMTYPKVTVVRYRGTGATQEITPQTISGFSVQAHLILVSNYNDGSIVITLGGKRYWLLYTLVTAQDESSQLIQNETTTVHPMTSSGAFIINNKLRLVSDGGENINGIDYYLFTFYG